MKPKLKAISVQPFFIPGGYTDSLQPLDVAVNKPLKDYYRSEWNDWMVNTEPIWLASGKRQRPSYENILGMVSRSLKKVENRLEIILNAFTASGLFINYSLDVFRLNR